VAWAPCTVATAAAAAAAPPSVGFVGAATAAVGPSYLLAVGFETGAMQLWSACHPGPGTNNLL
jgi:hypothetical protein